MQNRSSRLCRCLNRANGNCSVLRLAEKNSETTETCFFIGKGKVAPIEQTTLPKLEPEAAVIDFRLLSTILKNSSSTFDISVFWTDNQVVLDWIATDCHPTARNFSNNRS